MDHNVCVALIDSDRRRTNLVSPVSKAGATRAENFVYLFFVTWTLVGLCLDGWAHRHKPELETFFTPWHAVFYAGFVGAASWVAYMVIRRRTANSSLVASIPNGYELAVVGLGVFAVGGVGDGFWHTIFGVEVGLDALLSPTHVMMLVGMLGGATAPIRSNWRDPTSLTEGLSFRQFLPVSGSFAVTTTGIAFFFLYANGFNNWPMNNQFRSDVLDVGASLGVLSTISTTIILLAPAMILLRRWQPPFGTFALIFGVVGVFMAGLDAFSFPWQIVAPIVGGLTADLIVRWRSDRSSNAPETAGNRLASTARFIGVCVPLVMWLVYTPLLHNFWGVEWPPELWIGQIAIASLAGLALATIAFPPPMPTSPAAAVGGS